MNTTPRRAESPSPAKLAEVEERLLASAIERHPVRERAITHLLSAIERPAVEEPPAGRMMPLGDPARLEKMEDLLFEAILRTHHNGTRALDRLLGDVVGDAAMDDDTLDNGAEDVEMALYDMNVDSDCDGMG